MVVTTDEALYKSMFTFTFNFTSWVLLLLILVLMQLLHHVVSIHGLYGLLIPTYMG